MTDSTKVSNSNNQTKTIPEREREILSYWAERSIFKKTTGECLLSDGSQKTFSGDFVFYDGPPFATGLPHYGHILPGTIKDTIPRYQTMKGKRVLRRWGWDCHGLPVENLIQKELGLPTKKDIEEYGIDRFSEAAAASISRYFNEWKEIIPRTGRWVDMENYYRTMDPSFMESVWWSWKTLYDKGLLAEAFKAALICPKDETTLSNSEVNQGYKDVTDISVYVTFELVDEPGTYMLAWTTTPWTLPGNTALALHNDVDYVTLDIPDETGNSKKYIVAQPLLEKLSSTIFKDKSYSIVATHKGAHFVGRSYRPLFSYYEKARTEEIWKIWHADFITTDAGTGIAHQAPAFGAEDLDLAQKNNIPIIFHVGMDGRFAPDVTDCAGMLVKKEGDTQSADIEIIKLLAKNGSLFAKEKIIHSYPHCYRCGTPLLNYALSSWFVLVSQCKDRLVEVNKNIKWLPHEIGEGRFGQWLENARDWSVSRSRYWGTPLPIWKSQDGSEIEVLGSIADIKQRTRRNRYILMRHGEAEHNVQGIVSTHKDDPYHLTEKGRIEAEHSATMLKNENIDVIFVSPFIRTQETAEVVIKQSGFKGELHVDERITEFNLGDFSGQKIETYWGYFSSPEEKLTKRPPHGENMHDVRNRVGHFLYDIDSRYKDKTILIITHDGPARLIETVANGGDDKFLIESYKRFDFVLKTGEARFLDFAYLPHNARYELDLHRPYIDKVTWTKNGKTMQRIPDVFDTWYDSGAMPFASRHYPFEHKEDIENGTFFPADFIAEGLDQTRGWFYCLLVLGVALFDKSPYNRVVVNGLLLAEDGRKMSKSLKNYPPLLPTIEKYGADALRYFLISSPATRAEDVSFSEKALDEIVKKHFNRLLNVVSFFDIYKDAQSLSGGVVGAGEYDATQSPYVLDQWIMARLNEITDTVTRYLDTYELDKASRPLADFIDDLSTWYIRRSRDRFKSEDVLDRGYALATTRHIVLGFSIVCAPFLPFLAEDLYQKIKGPLESVHLEMWPNIDKQSQYSKDILKTMSSVRALVSRGLEQRAEAGIKIRQPLASLTLNPKHPSVASLIEHSAMSAFFELIQDEVNVKKIILADQTIENDIDCLLDTTLTTQLEQEGVVRDIIRTIQDARKKSGFNVHDRPSAEITAPAFIAHDSYIQEIKTATGLGSVTIIPSIPSDSSVEAITVRFV